MRGVDVGAGASEEVRGVLLLLVLVPVLVLSARSGRRRRGDWRRECLSIVCSVLCPGDVRRIE